MQSDMSWVMQTSDSSSISAQQVMNRLKAFSSSRGGLSHAFTLDMVQQAIKDWSLAQGTVCDTVQGVMFQVSNHYSCQCLFLLLCCAASLYIACALPVYKLGLVQRVGNHSCSVICWTPAAEHMLHLCNALKFSVLVCCFSWTVLANFWFLMDTGRDTARPSGPSKQNHRAQTGSLLSVVQDPEQGKTAAGCKPAVSFRTTSSKQQASPVGVDSAPLCMLHVQAVKQGPSSQRNLKLATVSFCIVWIGHLLI